MKISERINPGGKWEKDACEMRICPGVAYNRTIKVIINICEGSNRRWALNPVVRNLTKGERVAIGNKAADASYSEHELRCLHAVLSFYGKQRYFNRR
jgi:hypothetical protein